MLLLSHNLKRLIKSGTLTIIDARDQVHTFAASPAPKVTVRLHSSAVPWKLTFNPHLYLGEAYMDGTLTIEEGDIYDLLDLLTLNVARRQGSRILDAIAGLRRFTRWAAQYNPVARAKHNVAHHYDLSDDLYDHFLDQHRQYTCAYFGRANDDLETAQARKQAHIAAKLCLESGQHILDIGSGWGGLAFHLSQACDAEVTGITLSENQHEFANAEAKQRGRNHKVKFALQDYREVKDKYDRIVSVGMFEHVGVPHYKKFFTTLYNTLKDDGVALLHTIGRSDGPGVTNPWVSKYIFPGGYVPALSEIVPVIERAGFYITDIEVLRLHYAETLSAWRQRFNARRTHIRKLYDERFCRMWEFYLAVSEVAFRNAGHVVFQIQLAKQQDAVPLTRDYVTHWHEETKHDAAIAA